MHGSSGGTVVINISPMSEKEAENERLRDIARHSDQITSPGGHKCPSGGEIVRDTDVILYDHMGDESESSLFSADRMPDFLNAMGASEEEIVQLQSLMSQNSMENGVEPSGLTSFKRDYSDYRKFGGDTVAMELDREMNGHSFEMSDQDADDILGVAMGSSSSMGVGSTTEQAESALSEQFGRDAMAVMEGEVDGVVSFSVDSPELGRVRYVYDSRTGEGRVMRGE
tara:strand:+ start:3451 stop:4128 length:678 start_codon:yes stop_codon:yes gene_type:complete